MGSQVIRQPSGQLAIFDSVTDTIIVWDATEDEIVEWFAERAAESARRDARRAVEHVAAGNPRKAYYQFAMTWEEALAEDRRHRGTAWKEFRDG
ncbi:hypothetical protein [Nonomuraea angiospora]|uniref:hypothetical protein n=1 Tax=Nonomuraea angiospora TaxID=46172 RepID=UPI0029A5DF14|nr:hypothetical protein [Nonomuraea angiospora]MDX3110141.1 hypothetical protein [Nonomuraea angiospora]